MYTLLLLHFNLPVLSMAFMIAKAILQQHVSTLNDYMNLRDYSHMRGICKVLHQLCPPVSSMVKPHLCWGCKPGSNQQCSFAPKHMVARTIGGSLGCPWLAWLTPPRIGLARLACTSSDATLQAQKETEGPNLASKRKAPAP